MVTEKRKLREGVTPPISMLNSGSARRGAAAGTR